MAIKGIKMRALLIMLCSLLLAGCDQRKTGWAGYNEGQFTYLSSDSPGILKKIEVTKGQYVHQNDPLITFEPQPASDELAKANAELQAAQANRKSSNAKLDLAAITLQRYTNLLKSHSINQSEFDQVKSDYLNAQASDEQMAANLKAAQATVAKFEWNNQQRTIESPKDSLVFDIYYLDGEYVQAGDPVLALLSPKNIKAIFYLPEAEVGKLNIGTPVSIQCNGCPNPIKAKISYISQQAEFTPPVIYSNETKASLVFRIEAMPIDQNKIVLKPGQPVTIIKS